MPELSGFPIFVVTFLVFALVVVLRGFKAVSQGWEYTVERFGRYTRTLRPGFHLIVPVVNRIGAKMNMMENVLDVPEQEVITKDNAMVTADGVVFFQVLDAAKAAERGDASVQTNLARMYESGRGVRRNYAEAATWYHKAAEQDQASAQFALGNLYQGGKGVALDPPKAYFWLTLVAERGQSEVDKITRARAIGLRVNVGADLTPRHISEAKERARAWRPKSGAE